MPRLRNLLPWRRRRLERDLERELRYHLDRRIEDLTREGLTATEARRRASLELGGLAQVQEEVRDTWIWRWLGDRGRDLRYAARTLLRTPGFTATAVLSLAIGIGANAAIFSLVDQALFRLLPVNEPDRLVLLDWNGNALADGWGSGNLMSYPICRDLQEQRGFFDGVFCRHPTTVNLSTGGEHLPVGAEIVSGSYFPVLGVRPALGRLIDESDDRHPGAHPVVVLSYDYWQAYLGGADDIVGRRVLVNNFPMTVIGIASAGFGGVDFGEVPALWMPAMMKRQATPQWDRLLDRRARWMHVFGRLKPGITPERAEVGLQPWFKSMLHSDMQLEGFPQATADQRRSFLASTLTVTPAPQGRSSLRINLERPLWVLMAGTLLLLLLASLNVAGLFLARSATRARELTTRMALGASQARLACLLFADSLLVALGGGALGLAIAPWVSRALLSFLPQGAAQVDLTASPDGRVFLFAFLVSAVSGALCGLAPAWQAGRLPLVTWLKERAASSTGGLRLRKVLVVSQLAFTLVLLVGAGLFVQTLARLHEKGPGFPTGRVMTFGIEPLRNGYPPDKAAGVVRAVYEELASVPDVEHVGIASNVLLQGGSWNMFLTVQTDTRFVTDGLVHLNRISPDFFATLGARVIAGRNFDQRDVRRPGQTGDGRSVIVNESFAKRYLGGSNPIGRRIGIGNRPDTTAEIEVVGVVKDFSYRGIREETEQAYLAFFEGSGDGGAFYLRTRGTPESAFAAVRAAVGRIDPTLPLLSLRTLDEQVERSLTTERILATLSTGFGALALLLSVVGLYGVMSFVVTSRTQEIGIRLALGATPAKAMWLVIGDAVAMISAGTAIALPCVWALSRLVESQLFGVHALDAPTIAAASGLLAAVALGAATLPAWRAASVSPTDALRAQ